MKFINNTAKELGGGLYVTDSSKLITVYNSHLVNSLADCFIQPHFPGSAGAFNFTKFSTPSLWVSSVTVVNTCY